MPIVRKFIGWDRPSLAVAAEDLLESHALAGTADLRNIIAVVPGGRAGRRLLEILVEHAEQKSWTILPPRIVTVGQLAELLYVAKKPFAGSLVQQLAWVKALRSMTADELAHFSEDCQRAETH